jgi:CDP-diacylglycerol--glycerol-3-phosphate 3-phosphatidyltransferase
MNEEAEVAVNPSNVVWNVPNVLSATRLAISFVVFGLIVSGFYLWSLVLFAIAAGTDWLDGWWARKFNQVTKLGRVLDPFCDKILICGVFILLATKMENVHWCYSVSGILAVIVVGRELLVTALRSAIEGAGGDFSAKFVGKLKMVFQCLAAGAGLLFLEWKIESEPPSWLTWLLAINVWLTLVFTLYSGWDYVRAAIRIQSAGKD